MATFKAIIYPGKLRKDGKCKIYIRATIRRVPHYLPTNIYIEPSYFDNKAGRVRSGQGNSQRLNHLISKEIARLQDACYTLEIEGKDITIENLTKNDDDDGCFLEYAEKKLFQIRKTYSPETYRNYNSKIEMLKDIYTTIPFSSFNRDWIVRYENYLRDEENHTNTIAAKMKVLKTFWYHAMKDGIAKHNPFLNYTIKRQKTERVYLTAGELQKLWDMYDSGNMPLTHLKTLEAYLFCCYTGIRLGDVQRFSMKWVQDGKLVFTMKKVNEQVYIPLIENARKILDNNLGVFILQSPAKMRTTFDCIQAYAGIDKTITFHTSRHTFATVGLNKGIPLEVVQKLLGHSSINTTQIYAKMMNSTIDEQMKKWGS